MHKAQRELEDSEKFAYVKCYSSQATKQHKVIGGKYSLSEWYITEEEAVGICARGCKAF